MGRPPTIPKKETNMPIEITSPPIKFTVVKRNKRGYQYAMQPCWDQTHLIRVNTNKKIEIYFGHLIDNPTPNGSYSIKLKYQNKSPIEDPNILNSIKIQEPQIPIIHIDTTKIKLSDKSIYLQYRLIHTPPNESTGIYRSLWSQIVISP